MADSGNSALQRLVTITSVLAAAGGEGRSAESLAEVAGYGGTPESRRESLARDIRNLRKVGVDIRSDAVPGQPGHYVLRVSDSRIRLAFTAEQRAELARAALIAGSERIAAGLDDRGWTGAPSAIRIDSAALPVDLDAVLRAVEAGCLLRFTYNGKDRVLDPQAVQRTGREWTVSGFERRSGQPRVFAVTRMTAVSLGAPGSAPPGDIAHRPSTDPLSWHMNPAVEAVIEFEGRFAEDVARLLPGRALPTGDRRRATITVTNRWIFFARLAELGERVRLVGPPELRREFADRLRAVIEAA